MPDPSADPHGPHRPLDDPLGPPAASAPSPRPAAAPARLEVAHQTGADAPDASPPEAVPEAAHAPFAALRHRGFLLYMLGALLEALGGQVRLLTVGWDLYERTGSALVLGNVGLVLALPVLLLAFPAGAAADRFPRKVVMGAALAGQVACALGLAWATRAHAPLAVFYALLLGVGISSAFARPASQALVPSLVPPEVFPNAAKWSSMRWQLGATAGPLVAGALLALWQAPARLYVVTAACSATFALLLVFVTARPQERQREAMTWAGALEGARFVARQPLILSTITLDMVAVLFGGATALLPVFAKDVLGGGPELLGLLRAAPALGAVAMALTLALRPPMRRAGRAMLVAVVVFGLATLAFGLSRSVPLSLGALVVLGAADNVSVVVRSTLLQLLTPDAMRGRVSAVNAVFIGTSNEIGEWESGTLAHGIGLVPTVLVGGLVTLASAAVAARLWPGLVALGQLEDLRPPSDA